MRNDNLFFNSSSNSYFTNYEFAFSFKKRVSSATKSFNIRRSSDNATTDVLFGLHSEVNMSSEVSYGGSLGSWIGSDDGYMVVDYDQTGNGYDMVQNTASKQAKVISSGVWLGYKEYDGIDDIYFASKFCNNSIGSVYIKGSNTSAKVHYYIAQALSGDNKIFSLATDNSVTGKIRIIDFTPTINNLIGNTSIPVSFNILTYRGNGTNKSMRLNSINQSISLTSGSNTSNWFSFYNSVGFLLQKGGVIWTSNLYSNHKEYEILAFNVAHNDSESLSIENTM